jgi:hypothetical protein
MIALLVLMSSVTYAEELVGFQSVKCGDKEFMIRSINAFDAMELKDTKNIVHNVRSYGLGQGGANEWTCIRFEKSYLVFRGETTVHLSESKVVDLKVHDVFDTVKERFVRTGEIKKYVDLLEINKVSLAKKLYPKLDTIYRQARFRKFDFEF